MRSATTIVSHRIPMPALAALLLALAAVSACSSNGSSSNAGVPVHLTVLAGAGISGTVGTAIGPIVVRVTDSAGTAVQGVTVNYTVNAGATFTAPSVVTDARGDALTSLTLGHTAGAATVTAVVSGVTSSASFQVTGLADVASAFTITGGNHGSGTRGLPLPDPLTVRVTDQYDNGVVGLNINWVASAGLLAAATSRTDANGQASTQLTLPGAAGAITVTATAVINATPTTVTFNVTAN
ncbi:MAG: Ig-like domain-containing protein [Gemmatimonadales bacterium]